MPLISNSPHLQVDFVSQPYIDMSRPSAGMVRHNGSTLEIYDGAGWVVYQMNQSINVSGELNSIVAWARAKMQEEERLKALAAKFPALQKAIDNFELIKALVENEPVS